MNHVEQKLREEMAALRTENAPADRRTCPNCRLRAKASPDFDQGIADFWWCIAPVVLPTFSGAYLYQNMGLHGPDGAVGLPINLKLFDPASTYAASWNSRACPLFEAKP